MLWSFALREEWTTCTGVYPPIIDNTEPLRFEDENKLDRKYIDFSCGGKVLRKYSYHSYSYNQIV